MTTTTLKKLKVTEIPEGWEDKTAEEFCSKVTDGTHDSPKKQSTGKYLITSRHLKDNRLDFENAYFISEDDFNEINKRSKVDQWDVIFSMIGTVGEIYLEKRNHIAYAIKNVGLFKSGNALKGKWLRYYFQSPKAKDYIHRSRAGTTQEYMTLESLRKFPIRFPNDIESMQKIVSILESLDEKIDLNHRMNQTLEAIAQALFKRWFVDEDKDSSIGKLEDILEVIESGSRPKGGIDSTLTEGMPSIGAENINGIGFYDYSKTKYIPPDFFAMMNRGLIKNYDVLVYKDGAYIGRKSMFGNGFPFEKCCVNEHVFILRSNSRVSQFFLYFLLNQEELQQLNTNSAQPGLNQESMKSLRIKIPAKAKVDRFSEAVKPLIDGIFFNCNQARILSQIRDSLLPKLMSGKIKVDGRN